MELNNKIGELANQFVNSFNKIAELKTKEMIHKDFYISEMHEKLALLCNSKAKIILTITERITCSNCNLRKNADRPLVNLPCFHSICPACMKKRINVALHNDADETLLKDTSCPICDEPIPIDIIDKLLGEQELKKAINNNGITCSICDSKHMKKDLYKLSCGHFSHFRCIKGFLMDKINKGNVQSENLCCLIDGCNKPLHSFEIIDLINHEPITNTEGELKEKLFNFRLKFSEAANGEKIRLCSKCGYPQIIDLEEEVLTCPRMDCGVSACPECSSPPHPGISCTENLAKNNTRDIMNQMMIQRGLKYCPSCGGVMFKEKGCNFVWCDSSKCKKKNKFCNNCGLKLHDRDHWSHFLYSPFGDFCKVKC